MLIPQLVKRKYNKCKHLRYTLPTLTTKLLHILRRNFVFNKGHFYNSRLRQ